MTKKENTKLTPWFPPDVEPARPGVYDVGSWDDGVRVFSYWDGKAWRLVHWRKEIAATMVSVSKLQARRWRGLREQPKP